MSDYQPHRVFATNLLAESTRYGSIAAVCRGLGMNRQQFNKYLSGSTLPSPDSLDRICGFFGIGAERLFAPPSGEGAVSADPVVDHATSVITGAGQATLREGCYSLFFPWPGDPAVCVRAGLALYHHQGRTLFSRLARYRTPGRRQRHHLRTRDDGIVLSANGALHMLAHARKGFRDISLMSFGAANALNSGLLNGLALGSGIRPEPLAMRVALEYHGSLDRLRDVAGRSGLVPLHDPGVPDQVRRAMSPATPWLRPYSPVDPV